MFDRSIRALAVALLATAGSLAAARDVLPPAVLQARRTAGVPPSAMAAVALPLAHRAPPWRHRADVPMQPASTMKLVTSIVALDRLGPNRRGHTELRSAAPLAGAVLQGDLVLKGGADPDLGVAQFWALLVDLRQAGVESITGDLIVDRTLFRPPRQDIGVAPFDESPEFPYNAVPDALQLAGNLLPLEIQATADGVRASTVPPLDGITFSSRMGLSAAACKDWEDDWKPALVQQAGGRTHIELRGAFPAGCTQRAELQLIDRLELAERLFRTLWAGLGGSWAGQAREAAAPADTRLLARHQSRTWGEVLRPMNKTSDNAHTRLLYLTLGASALGADPQITTTELAAHEVRGWLAEHHINAAGLVLDNGSGLSRSERITPWQLAAMLKAAYRGQHASDLLMSLPVAGVDGSLRKRLQDSPATGWARLKTGTLRNVVALAGVLRDGRGRPWAVAMMINHEDASRALPALDALVDSFARVGPARQQGSAAKHRRGTATRPALLWR